MNAYDVQDIHIDAPAEQVFAFVADASRSPEWAEAFASVDGDRAVLRTPRGEVEIGLEVLANAEQGTVDWHMSFPDGTVETAYSRVLPIPTGGTVFTFVLLPSAPMLDELEGDLAQQSKTLGRELRRLKELLEHGTAG